MQGFYSFITSCDFQSAQGMNVLTQKNFQFFGSFPLADWGNPQLLEVVKRVQAWEPLLDIETANGYFRAKLLMSEGQGWFWALEWNKWMRVIGGLCDQPMPVFDGLPELSWFAAPGNRRFRREVALEGDDVLFPPRNSANGASEAERGPLAQNGEPAA